MHLSLIIVSISRQDTISLNDEDIIVLDGLIEIQNDKAYDLEVTVIYPKMLEFKYRPSKLSRGSCTRGTSVSRSLSVGDTGEVTDEPMVTENTKNDSELDDELLYDDEPEETDKSFLNEAFVMCSLPQMLRINEKVCITFL